MNSTKDQSSHGNKLAFGDYGFGMGLSFGTIFMIVIIVCVSWKCFFHMRAARRNATTRTIPKGLDEATLLSLPKFLYSEAKLQPNSNNLQKEDHSNINISSSGCCSVCLADYKDNHMVRELPYCGHLFHVDCVDPWLRLQATCPICRDSPILQWNPMRTSQ